MNGMDYYKYQLMDGGSPQASAFLKSSAQLRRVSGANAGEEELLYQRACEQAIKNLNTALTASVVVAHFDEDLSWMNRINARVAKFVYSKGENVVGEKLPNVGRDYHTYLTHIVRHYDMLTDVVFFLQGWPLDRSAHVVTSVNWLRHFHYIEFGTNILETGPVGDQLLDFMGRIFSLDPSGYNRRPWEFRANTQFGASRMRIRHHPREFYEKCAKVCEEGVPDLGIGVETVPYLFEQIWSMIFV